MVSAVSGSSSIGYPTPASILAAQVSTAQSSAPTTGASASTAQQTNDSATNVTLSAEAQQALANETPTQKDFATVIASARENMNKLLSEAEVTSPLKEGKLAVNLSNFDSRELFAITVNTDSTFPQDQQDAAKIELQRRADDAISVAVSVFNVTDDLAQLYKDVKNYLDNMSLEEKATSDWAKKAAAVDEVLSKLEADPDAEIKDIANDPISDYLDRLEAGEVEANVNFADLGNAARKALDLQYADAKSSGQELLFTKRRTDGQQVDFSNFDARSLSAIVLNEGGNFDPGEMHAAKQEVKHRSGQAVLAAFKNASESGDIAAFSKNLLAQYGSMSSEERQAADWSPSFYDTIVSNYKSSSHIGSMFGGGGASGSPTSFFS